MAPSKSSGIAIIGGGLGGLTLSIGLTRNNIPHKIYESAPAFAEIGAGITMGPNAIQALLLIDPGIREAYERCATYNESEADKIVWQILRYGMEAEVDGGVGFGDVIARPPALGLRDDSPKGRSSFHRAKFLDELIQKVPSDVAEFKKTMTSVEQDPSGCTISFQDGTSARASAVICCDGIKSQGRKIVLGADSPALGPTFAGEYAYRVLCPREEANEIFGPEGAGNGTIWCGYNGYVVTYPVDKGRLINVTACLKSKSSTWDHDAWLAPTLREDMVKDFEGWGRPIHKLLEKIKDTSRWALFDAPPAPTFYKGRICLMGDAAHATTPHQGAGAGMAFEDAYILSSLLGSVDGLERATDVFRIFDAIRRPRTQKLVATSREAGDLYGLRADGIGRDFKKLEENVKIRHRWYWESDFEKDVERARAMLR